MLHASICKLTIGRELSAWIAITGSLDHDKNSDLARFRPNELLFDAQETRDILKFIFISKKSVIDTLKPDDSMRAFAQGLLLEAIDASFAIGFVAAIWRATVNPTSSVSRILQKFSRKAAMHWFKQANTRDLNNIRIYEIVRRDIDYAFGRIMGLYIEGVASQRKPYKAIVRYDAASARKVVQA
jgi:hypothetical protein